MIDVLTAVLERSLDQALTNLPRVIHTLSTVITPARVAANELTSLKGTQHGSGLNGRSACAQGQSKSNVGSNCHKYRVLWDGVALQYLRSVFLALDPTFDLSHRESVAGVFVHLFKVCVLRVRKNNTFDGPNCVVPHMHRGDLHPCA